MNTPSDQKNEKKEINRSTIKKNENKNEILLGKISKGLENKLAIKEKEDQELPFKEKKLVSKFSPTTKLQEQCMLRSSDVDVEYPTFNPPIAIVNEGPTNEYHETTYDIEKVYKNVPKSTKPNRCVLTESDHNVEYPTYTQSLIESVANDTSSCKDQYTNIPKPENLITPGKTTPKPIYSPTISNNNIDYPESSSDSKKQKIKKTKNIESTEQQSNEEISNDFDENNICVNKMLSEIPPPVNNQYTEQTDSSNRNEMILYGFSYELNKELPQPQLTPSSDESVVNDESVVINANINLSKSTNTGHIQFEEKEIKNDNNKTKSKKPQNDSSSSKETE